MKTEILSANVHQVQDAIKTGNSQVVDVREAFEYEAEHIAGAVFLPLSQLSSRLESCPKNLATYVVCRSGNRARQAATILAQQGMAPVYVMEGGLNAWKAAGLVTEIGKRKIWGMERQVRCAAGGLVTLGVLLGWFFHPSFVVLSLLVGCGLIFSAVTDTCGMAMVLAKMPWNKGISCKC